MKCLRGFHVYASLCNSLFVRKEISRHLRIFTEVEKMRKLEISCYAYVAEVQFETCLRFLGFAFVLDSPDSSKAKVELISGEER